jgi:hypothetical protein
MGNLNTIIASSPGCSGGHPGVDDKVGLQPNADIQMVRETIYPSSLLPLRNLPAGGMASGTTRRLDEDVINL